MTTIKLTSEITDQLLDQATPGVTVSAIVGQPLPRTGYLVGGVVPAWVGQAGLEDNQLYVDQWVDQHVALVAWSNATYFGSWTHTPTGRVFIDVSNQVPELDRAMALARSRGELSIYAVATGEVIEVEYDDAPIEAYERDDDLIEQVDGSFITRAELKDALAMWHGVNVWERELSTREGNDEP